VNNVQNIDEKIDDACFTINTRVVTIEYKSIFHLKKITSFNLHSTNSLIISWILTKLAAFCKLINIQMFFSLVYSNPEINTRL